MNPCRLHRSVSLQKEAFSPTGSSWTVRLGVPAVGSVGLLVASAVLLVSGVVLLFTPELLSAQAQPPQPARQMRHFWHVFVAYAVAWVLVFGWAVSIARRLRRVEEKLER